MNPDMMSTVFAGLFALVSLLFRWTLVWRVRRVPVILHFLQYVQMAIASGMMTNACREHFLMDAFFYFLALGFQSESFFILQRRRL